MMRNRLLTAFAALSLTALAPVSTPAPVADLVRSVDIPFEQFTLTNGLRVVVHTDRKAPIVAVSVWYGIGSKDEPVGKTGFAHLFEHLMFNGSENNPGEFFLPLENVGATDSNGTTSSDRTNYFETVPTPALDLALFLESDRMGYLLGAVNQQTLDNQRGVVQNEKRQGDNQPFGLTDDLIRETLFPKGHPYRHSPIGSMADLDAASLQDVQAWFKANYRPNNAVLVLAGDIDAATARPLVEKHFGAIPRGPDPLRRSAALPIRTATTRATMQDRIATTRLIRTYLVPGRFDPVTPLLDVAAAILGSGGSSRLYNDLVRDKRIAVGVGVGIAAELLASQFTISVDVKPGVDPSLVEARIDAVVAQFLKDGPSDDEVSRVATREVGGRIRGLEEVGGFGGKAGTLAEGLIYTGDPGYYRTEMGRYAAATPAAVVAAARLWINRGDFRLTMVPGPRPQSAEAASAPAAPSTIVNTPATPPTRVAPKVAGFPELDFPKVERARLANGIDVTLARRTTVPVVRMTLSFDAGNAADPKAKLGTQGLVLALIDEGTSSRSATQIVEEGERIGASIGASAGIDRTRLTLNALKPNLAASLALFADIVRNPAFADTELTRVRAQMLNRIAAEETQPQSLAFRELPPLLYGIGHPYGIPFTGTGTAAGVAAVTRDDLVAFQQAWLRPDNGALFVVGDVTMAELLPMLEASLGDWRAPTVAKSRKLFPAAPPPPNRIILIDRPGSPQSLILAGTPLAVKGTEDPLALSVANDILGGNFTSRLNANLREDKGWAYGVSSSANIVREQMPFLLSAPVQTDKTGPSITAMISDMQAFRASRPPTTAELERTVNNTVRSLPGAFESGGEVLSSIERNFIFGRPDSYQTDLPARYRAMTIADLKTAAADLLDPSRLLWIVIGDRAQVESQLQAIGLPVEIRR